MGATSGRHVAEQLKLPYGIVHDGLQKLKAELLIGYKGSAGLNDYTYELSENGFERAQRYWQRCTYFGSAPVTLDSYIESVNRQSCKNATPRLSDVQRALSEFVLPAETVSQIGQAVNAGRALFLHGSPGNGKTTIAERIIRSLSDSIWIPRTITVTGEIIRLFDPSCHIEDPLPADESVNGERYDHRWVRIRRPTIVVGGELTFEHLEITHNQVTGLNESPIQLKSNGGALVIDDFGRQRISTAELLNRWIIPLEKGHDYLSLTSGRQIQVPFDPLVVFATNLLPEDVVDEAFLRRIPFKIEMVDPTEAEFRALFEKTAEKLGVETPAKAFDHLVTRYYRATSRPFRYCHVRDLLFQVQNYCSFHEQPLDINEETLNIAARNYFGNMSEVPTAGNRAISATGPERV